VTTILMRLFHAPDRVTVLAKILQSCLGDTPPDSLPSWKEALGQEQYQIASSVDVTLDRNLQLQPPLSKRVPEQGDPQSRFPS